MSTHVVSDCRRWLIVACLFAVLPLAWRVDEVASELQRGRQAAALYNRGFALRRAGRVHEARALFRQVVILAPFDVEAYASLADAQLRLGEFEGAIQTYRRVLAIYPYTHFGSLYREVGFIELRSGRLQDARRDLTSAVALDPTDWHAYYLLGHVYKRLHDPSAARSAWHRVLELRPGYQPAHRQLLLLDSP